MLRLKITVNRGEWYRKIRCADPNQWDEVETKKKKI